MVEAEVREGQRHGDITLYIGKASRWLAEDIECGTRRAVAGALPSWLARVDHVIGLGGGHTNGSM